MIMSPPVPFVVETCQCIQVLKRFAWLGHKMSVKLDSVLMDSLEHLHDRLSLLEGEAHSGLGVRSRPGRRSIREVVPRIDVQSVARGLIEKVDTHLHLHDGSMSIDEKDDLEEGIRSHVGGILKSDLLQAVRFLLSSGRYREETGVVLAECIENAYAGPSKVPAEDRLARKMVANVNAMVKEKDGSDLRDVPNRDQIRKIRELLGSNHHLNTKRLRYALERRFEAAGLTDSVYTKGIVQTIFGEFDRIFSFSVDTSHKRIVTTRPRGVATMPTGR